MTRNTHKICISAAACAVSGLASASVAGEYRFDFSGTVNSGTGIAGADLSGSDFTLSLFIADTAVDQTPGEATANFILDMATLDIGSDGSTEETSVISDPLAALYIDPGSTQLVGGFDLLNPDIAFLIGVNLPSGSFADPKDLSGQSDFSLSGLTPATLSFYMSDLYDIDLDVTSFGFSSTTAVVPLPAPVAMGGAGLLFAGLAARRRRLSR